MKKGLIAFQTLALLGILAAPALADGKKTPVVVQRVELPAAFACSGSCVAVADGKGVTPEAMRSAIDGLLTQLKTLEEKLDKMDEQNKGRINKLKKDIGLLETQLRKLIKDEQNARIQGDNEGVAYVLIAYNDLNSRLVLFKGQFDEEIAEIKSRLDSLEKFQTKQETRNTFEDENPWAQARVRSGFTMLGGPVGYNGISVGAAFIWRLGEFTKGSFGVDYQAAPGSPRPHGFSASGGIEFKPSSIISVPVGAQYMQIGEEADVTTAKVVLLYTGLNVRVYDQLSLNIHGLLGAMMVGNDPKSNTHEAAGITGGFALSAHYTFHGL